MKFEVPQRRQLASERTSLTLFAPAHSTISFVPLTRNLSLADSSPYPVRGWTGLSEATATRFKASTDCSTCPPVATVKLGNAYQFEKFGTGNSLLRYGIRIRCSKRLPGVRDASSEAFGAKNRHSGTEEIFGTKNSLLWYAKRFLRHSATKKGSWGTRCVFKGPQNSTCYIERPFKGAQNSRLHRLWTASCRTQRIFRGVPCQKQHLPTGRIFSARNGPALFVRSGGPFPCSFDGTRYQKRPPLVGEQI